MYKNKRILSLIPARGGSKGLPGKNIRTLIDKPLVAWSIIQASVCRFIDKVIVSTDDNEIAEISRSYGGEVPFMRPPELAQDSSTSIDVISHTLDFLHNRNDNYDYLLLMEPTSPLRKKGDIDNAIIKLIDNAENAHSLISLGEIHLEHPYISKVISNDRVKSFIETMQITHRQNLPKVYFPYGVVYLSKVETILEDRTFYQHNALPYIIERWQNYEVDDIYDFICIESIMKEKIGEII